jgi:hypothetical protein
MDLVRRFPPALITRALEDWAWLPGIESMIPLATSAFGDVFLEGEDAVWFLDTIEGKLTREWEDTTSLQEALNTADGQARFLLDGLAEAAYARGVRPDPEQVLSFKIAPVLGGAFKPDNIEVTDLVVSLSISGQLHRQVKDLPPGTRISGFTIDEQPP